MTVKAAPWYTTRWPVRYLKIAESPVASGRARCPVSARPPGSIGLTTRYGGAVSPSTASADHPNMSRVYCAPCRHAQSGDGGIPSQVDGGGEVERVGCQTGVVDAVDRESVGHRRDQARLNRSPRPGRPVPRRAHCCTCVASLRLARPGGRTRSGLWCTAVDVDPPGWPPTRHGWSPHPVGTRTHPPGP